MTRFRHLIARTMLVCSAGGLGAPSAAQVAEPPLTLTIDDAIARGLATSHRLAEATARADAAHAAASARHADLLPHVAAEGGYTRTNHVDTFGVLLPNNQFRLIYPDVPDNYRTRLDLQWPIYTGGRVDALERAARAEAAAATEDAAAAKSDLRLEISRAYWALVTAAESMRAVEESLHAVQAHALDVKNQFDVGLLPPNDVAAATAQASRERMLEAQAHTTRTTAELDLARLIGVPPGTRIEPSVALTPPPLPASPPDELVNEALKERREREALQRRLAAAEARVRAARAGSRPSAAVGGGVDYANPNPRIFPRDAAWKTSWDASINVSWPIFDGGRTEAAATEAEAQARAARERLAEFDATVATEVRQRAQELSLSREAIAAAEDAVRSAAEARRVVGDRFDAGVATSTDVLEAQAALLQAELDRTQAIAAARLSEARLSRAVGR